LAAIVLAALKVDLENFTVCSYAAVDLSTTHITAFVILSEPNEHGKGFIKPFLFCPEDN
jgi:hypothetical protein